jgi:hypothetical protein
MRQARNDSSLRYDALRRSHFVAPFGVGSIVDLPHESLMPLAIDYWSSGMGITVHDERLEERLGVSHFRMAPSKQDTPTNGVPCVRFPRWLFCPKCRFLRSIVTWEADGRHHRSRSGTPECHVCRIRLVPARFVVVCDRGHIDDFPWVAWVHRGESCANPSLKISTGGSSSGLAGIRVSCTSCGSERNMAGSFSRDAHSSCSGYMPWLGKREECTLVPRTLQRGASNTYFPLVVNSIVMPSDTNRLDRQIKESDWFDFLRDRRADSDLRGLAVRRLATELQRDIKEIEASVQRILDTTVTRVRRSEWEYRYDEYMMFLGLAGNGEANSVDLETTRISADEYRVRGIESVTLVHRLREVRALVAFSRIHPLDRRGIGAEDDKDGRATAVSVRGERVRDWLPAVEARGEGIFIQFSCSELQDWATDDRVTKRADTLHDRYGKMATERGFSVRRVSPEFLFLHTFAHLLIRQLTFECGYGSASLRERIYYSESDDQPYMAGVLIYTASGDADGTLGGLVRQGQPDCLPGLMSKAAASAYWCSSDPLCIESSGQGLGSLNLAACHACTLLPETSCEEFNWLLDRAMLVGLPNEPRIGFLLRMLGACT